MSQGREIVHIHRLGHDYVLIPCEVLDGVRADFGIMNGGEPGEYRVYEYMPGGTILEGFAEPAPPGGSWEDQWGGTFPNLNDARYWLEVETSDWPDVFWGGMSRILDADMPWGVRVYVHGGKA